MNAEQLDAFLDSLDSPVLGEKNASLFVNPITARLFEGSTKGISSAGKYLGGLAQRAFRPTVQRFQQGAEAAANRYSDDLVKRVLQRSNAGVAPEKLVTGADKVRGALSTVGGGLQEAVGQSLPGRALGGLANRNSNFWRGAPGAVMGRDPLTAAFNVYAGLEGARKGKEVGGTSGAIAGGLGAFGASRAAWAMGDVFKRGLMRDMQNQMLSGRMTALRARPGALRGAMGDWLQRGGKAAEGMLGGRGGQLVGQGGKLQGTIDRLQKVRTKAQKGALTVPGPKGNVALPMTSGGAGGGNPTLSSLVTVPLGIGTMIAAQGAADKGGEMAFDGYKRMSDGMHQRQQRTLARENHLRGISPEFRTTGYNPYANYGG